MSTPERVTGIVLVTPDDRRIQAEEVALGFLSQFKGSTRKNYTGSLRQWFAFCEEHGIPVLGAKRAHIDLYSRQMEEDLRFLRSTVAAKQSVVIGFYRYAVEEGYLPVSPAQYIKRLWAERVSTTKHLTRTELRAVLELAKDDANPHSHAVVCLLGLNGLRVGEMVGLDVEHLGTEVWHPTIYLPMRKGGKAATLPLANQTAFAIHKILEGRTSGPVFLMGSGRRMDRNQAARIVKRLAARAGVTKRISPHSLRHSFITLSLNAGATTRDVMISAGHADERMTAYYDRAKDSLSRNTTFSVASYIEGAD